MGSLEKETRGTLSLLFALLQEVEKLLMESEPIISNRNCSLLWGINSPKQHHGMWEQVKVRLYCQSILSAMFCLDTRPLISFMFSS